MFAGNYMLPVSILIICRNIGHHHDFGFTKRKMAIGAKAEDKTEKSEKAGIPMYNRCKVSIITRLS